MSAPTRQQRVLEIIQTARSKRPRLRDEHITMAHGAGGRSSQALIEGLLLPLLENERLATLADASTFTVGDAQLALSTDCFVVRPIRFPGGSIGELAVNGTVNDLAVTGARAIALTLSLLLEEGLDTEELRAEVDAVARAAERAGVEVIAGDTKVVEHGHADGMYVCTTGLGLVDPRARLSTAALSAGDRVLVSGPIAAHGMAIMLARGEFELEAPICSDTTSLWPAVDALLQAAGPDLHCMRDATRGGVASALNELARASGVGVQVREREVPVAPAVAAASRAARDRPLVRGKRGPPGGVRGAGGRGPGPEQLRSVPGCEQAADIGEVSSGPPGMVLVETGFGGRRVLDLLAGDPLPRIC